MVDTERYIKQLSDKIRTKELNNKKLASQNAKLVLENAQYADEIEKLYSYLKHINKLDSYYNYRSEHYVSNNRFCQE